MPVTTIPLRRVSRIDRSSAVAEYGTVCQRVFPEGVEDDTLGSMVCWLEPGAATAPDQHDQRELMIVSSGSGSVVSDGVREPLAVGDVLLIERNARHVVEASEDGLAWVSVWWPLREPTADAAESLSANPTDGRPEHDRPQQTAAQRDDAQR